MRRKVGSIGFVIVFGLAVAGGRGLVFSAEKLQEKPQAAKEAGKAAEKKVAALVNGEPIYEEQVNTEYEKSWGDRRKRGGPRPSPDVVKQLHRQALEAIIDNVLIRQESEKLKIDDLEQKVEQKLKDLEKKYGDGAGVEKYLKYRSLTVETYKTAVRPRVYVDEYLKRQGISEPDVPEDQIRQMYETQGTTREEMVQVSHILIAADPHATAEAQEQARRETDKIRAEIIQGRDFAEMAKEHSKCNSAAGGGDLGFVKRGYMPKEFDQVAFALEKGAVSEVVKSKFGYHIIKVVDKCPAGRVPYEELRDFYRKFLQQEESKKKLASHVAELKKKAKIEVLLK